MNYFVENDLLYQAYVVAIGKQSANDVVSGE
jgi:hypothetical protein